MIDPTVRSATPDDAPALVELQGEARTLVAGSRGGPRWLAEHPAVDDWVSAIGDRIVLVATVATSAASGGSAEVPVGYLLADVVDEPTVRVLRIDQVFVHPDAREVGFGDELLAAAMDAGRVAGAALVEAHTLPGDREIKNLYERAGVTARLITVSKPLS